MSPELIAMLITYAPTIIVLLEIVACVLVGFLQGFRKSSILFLNFVIALAIGLGSFFVVSHLLYTKDISQVLALVGNFVNIDFGEAKSISDAVAVVLREFVLPADFAFVTEIAEYQQVITAISGVIINLALGLVCLIVIPIVVRIILYVIYLIFFREGRFKNRTIDEGGVYRRQRLFGLLVGLGRGLVLATLSISLLSSAYFIVAGGDFESKEETPDYTLLNNIEEMFGLEGVDTNAIYAAINKSRTTGVGFVYEMLGLTGDPIDYYAFDLLFSSEFDSNVYYGKNQFNLRKELANILNLVETIIESDAVSITVEDGQYKYYVDQTKVDDAMVQEVANSLQSSVILTEFVPSILKGTAVAIAEGKVSLPEEFKEYFSTEVVEAVNTLSLNDDLFALADALIAAVPLIPLTEDQQIDMEKVQDLNTWVNLDPVVVATVFDKLSKVKLITDVAAPIGAAFALSQFGGELGISEADVDLANVDWAFEVHNIGSLYGYVAAMNLDLNRLMGTSEQPKGAMIDEDALDDRILYLLELVEDENIQQQLNNIVDGLIGDKGSNNGSYLIGQIAVVAIKVVSKQVDLGSFNIGCEGSMYELLADVLATYKPADLRTDLHTIVDSCLSLLPLVDTFTKGEKTFLQLFKEINIDSLRYALLGEHDAYFDKTRGGIYGLKIFGDKLEVVLDAVALHFTSEYEINITEEEIKGIESWRTELEAVISAVEVVQSIDGIEQLRFNDPLNTMPTNISDLEIDLLTKALGKSVLVSGIAETYLLEYIDSDMAKEYHIVYREYDSEGNLINEGKTWAEATAEGKVVWFDKYLPNGNVEFGELNKVLKAAVIIIEDGIDLSSPQTILDKIIYLNEVSPETGRPRIDKITDSKVVGIALTGAVEFAIEEMVTFVDIDIPTHIGWDNVYDNDGVLVRRGELYNIVAIVNLANEINAEFNIVDLNTPIENLGSTSLNVFSAPQAIRTLDIEDVNTITNSQIISGVLPSILDFALNSENNGIIDIVLPTETTWENVYDNQGNLVKSGELWNIVQIVQIDAFDKFFDALSEQTFSFDVLADFSIYQALEREDIDLITNSQIISGALDDIIEYALSALEGTLPFEVSLDAITWENVYDNQGRLVQTGELWLFANLLDIEAFHTDGVFDYNKLVDIHAYYKLEHADVELVGSSQILAANAPTLIEFANTAIKEFGLPFDLTIPADIDWKEELKLVVDILHFKAFEGTNLGGSHYFDTTTLEPENLIQTIQKITEADLEKVFNSELIMANLDPVLDYAISLTGLQEVIEIPVNVNWASELYNFIEILNISDFQTNGVFDYTKFLDIKTWQKVSPAIDILRSSNLLMSNLTNVANYFLTSYETVINGETVVFADLVTIPVDTNWFDELQLIVDLLNIEAFQGEDGIEIEKLMNPANYELLAYEDLAIMSESKIICSNLSKAINKLLEVFDLNELVTIPAGINWQEELYRVVEVLQTKAFDIIAYNEEDEFRLERINNPAIIVEAIKSITSDDIAILTDSALVMSNLDKVLTNVLTQVNAGFEIVIPAGIDWNSELMRVVNVLNTEAFETIAYSNGEFTLSQITDIEVVVKAIRTLTDDDVAILTDSKLIMSNIDAVLNMALETAGLKDVVTIPAGVNWHEELMRVVRVLDTEAFNTIAYSQGQLALGRLSDPAIVIEGVKSIKSEEVAILTDSKLVMSNIDSVLAMVLETAGLKDVVTIPAGTDWNTELMRIVDVLNTKAFEKVAYVDGEFTLSQITSPSVIIEAVKTLTSTDLAILTDSKLAMSNIDKVLSKVLETAGLTDLVTIPVGINWNEELMRVVDLLNTKAFEKVAYVDGELSLSQITNPTVIIEALRSISSEEVSIFTDSKLIMSNIDSVLSMVLETTGLKDVVTIPAGINWHEELMRVVDVLNTEAFERIAYVDGELTFAQITDLEVIIKAIKSLTNEDVAILTDSKLIMSNIDAVLNMALETAGLKDVVTIPAGVNWHEELMRVVDVLNTNAFETIAYSQGQLALGRLTEPAIVIEGIKAIKSEEVAILTDSKLVMSNIDSVLAMVLETAGLTDLVTIPAGIDWNAELMRVVNVLNTEAFNTIAYNNQGELRLERINNPAIIVEAVKSITSTDLSILTDSKLVMSNIDSVLAMVLETAGVADLVTIPVGINWNEELMRVVDLLNTKAFETIAYVDGEFTLTQITNPSVIVEALKAISSDEVSIFTDSKIIMSNIDSVLSMVLETAGVANLVTIPAGINWHEELMRIVAVLNTEAFDTIAYANGEFTLSQITDIEVVVKAIRSLTDEDVAILTDSKLVMSNVDAVLNMALETTGVASLVTIPAGVNWHEELMRVVDVLNTNAFETIAYSQGQLALGRLSDPAILVEGIKAITSEEVAILTDSKLVMSNIDSVLSIALDKLGVASLVTIPAGTDWNTELMRIVNVLNTEAFNTIAYVDGEFTLTQITNPNALLKAIKTITSEDVAIFTDSKLVMSNIDKVVEIALSKAGLTDLITIPAGVNWNEEFMRVVSLLQTEAFHMLLEDENNNLDLSILSSLDINSILAAVRTIKEDEIKLVTESKVVMSNIDSVLETAIAKTGLTGLVTIPAGTNWTQEFANLVKVLKLDALKDASGEYFLVEDLSNVNNIVAILRGIEEADIELITESKLIMTNVSNLIPVVIEKSGYASVLTVPASTDWTKEIENLIHLVDLKAFSILLEDNAGNIVLNKLQNVNTILEAIQSISLDEIHIITESELIMANVSKALPKVIARLGVDGLVTIPAGTDWGEELYRIVRLLQIEEFWNEEDLFDISKLTNIYTLTAGLQQLDKEDIAIITESPLLMANFNSVIAKAVAASQYNELITVPVGINWTEELYHLVEFLNVDNFCTEGEFDFRKVLELNNYKGITTSEAKVITSSTLFAANINSLVQYVLDTRDLGVDITLPAYVNWTNEFVVVSKVLEIEAFQDENGKVSLGSIANMEAFKCLTGDDIEILTQSTLFMANINDLVDVMLERTGLDVTITLPAYVNWTHELHVLGEVLDMPYFNEAGTNKLDFGKMKDVNTYAEMSDDDIDVMTSSAIFNATVPAVFEMMLERTGYSSSIAMPGYVNWANELKVIRDVLSIYEFQGEDGFEMAKVKSIETFFGVESEALAVVAKSAIFGENIDTLMSKALNKFGFADMVIPSYVNWEEEIVALVNIIKLLEEEGKSGLGNSYYIDKFADIETIKNFSVDDCDTLTSSQIFVANANALIGDKVTEQNSSIIIPENVEWANRYDKDGNLVAEGELWTLVQILNIDAFNGPDGLGSMSMDTLKTIGTDPMTPESDKSEVDLLMDSQIFSSSIDSLVRDNINTNATAGNEIIVPANIEWASSFDADGRVIKRGELYNLVKALNIDGMEITNINKDFLNTLSEEDVNTLTNSRIITSNLHSTIDRAFQEGKGLTLPAESSINWANSYDENGVLVEAGELWTLIQIISLIDVNNVSIASLQSLNMIDGKETIDGKEAAVINSDLLTSSVIFMANIDRMVKDALEAQSVAVPTNIVWENIYDNNDNLAEAGELLALIRALNIAQFQSEGSFNFNLVKDDEVLDELDLSDPEIERAINDSEIIRRSFSDSIVTNVPNAPETDALGATLFDNEALKATEIMALLNAVKVDGLKLDGNVSEITVSTIADNLDKLVASSIIHALISDTIIEQNIVPTTVLTANAKDNYITETELSKLIDALLLAGVNNASDITNTINFAYVAQLAKDGKLESTCQSTILRVLYTDLINDMSGFVEAPNPYYADKMMVIDNGSTREVAVYTATQIVNFVESYNAYIDLIPGL